MSWEPMMWCSALGQKNRSSAFATRVYLPLVQQKRHEIGRYRWWIDSHRVEVVSHWHPVLPTSLWDLGLHWCWNSSCKYSAKHGKSVAIQDVDHRHANLGIQWQQARDQYSHSHRVWHWIRNTHLHLQWLALTRHHQPNWCSSWTGLANQHRLGRGMECFPIARFRKPMLLSLLLQLVLQAAKVYLE